MKPTAEPGGPGHACRSHGLMIFSSSISALAALTVHMLGEAGVTAPLQMLCALAIRCPLVLGIVLFRGIRHESRPVGGDVRDRPAWLALLAQGLLGGLLLIFFFCALVGLQLGPATAIIYSEAAWVPLLAAAVAGEAFGYRNCLVLGIALAGVLLIAGTDHASLLPTLAALGDVVFFSCIMVVTRLWMPEEDLWVAQGAQLLFAAAFACILAGLQWRHNDFAEIGQLLFPIGHSDVPIDYTLPVLVYVGNLLGVAQLWSVQTAVRLAPKDALANVMLWIYLTPVLSLILGLIRRTEMLSLSSMLGVVLIFLALGSNQLMSRLPTGYTNIITYDETGGPGIDAGMVEPGLGA